MTHTLTSFRLLLKHNLLRLCPWTPYLKSHPWHSSLSLFLALFSVEFMPSNTPYILLLVYYLYPLHEDRDFWVFLSLFTVVSPTARSAPTYNKCSINIWWMIFWKKICLHYHIKLNWIWTSKPIDSRTRLHRFKSWYHHLLAVNLGQVI